MHVFVAQAELAERTTAVEDGSSGGPELAQNRLDGFGRIERDMFGKSASDDLHTDRSAVDHARRLSCKPAIQGS